MEQFPDQFSKKEAKKESVSGITKAAIVGAALASIHTAEAQFVKKRDIDPNNNIAYALNGGAEQQKLYERMFSNFEKIEERAKKLSPKIYENPKITYAVLTESSALGAANYSPNNLEAALTEDVEAEMVNKEHKDYAVVTRDPGAFRVLLKERSLMEEVENTDAARRVFEYYTPVDMYITVGAQRENDSTLTATIRMFDMNTKKASTYVLSHTLLRNAIPEDGYNPLRNAVQSKISELVSQYGEK